MNKQKEEDDSKTINIVSVFFSKEELGALTNLLGMTSQLFEQLAIQAIEQNDEHAYNILTARSKLSRFYSDKLIKFYDMPEPESKDLH